MVKNKKNKIKEFRIAYRSAISGQFVTESYEKKHSKTTIKEKIRIATKKKSFGVIARVHHPLPPIKKNKKQK